MVSKIIYPSQLPYQPGSMSDSVQYAPRNTGSPEHHPTPRGRATAPCPPHTAALSVLGERRDAAANLGERGGGVKGTLPGTGCLVHGMPADPRIRGREGFSTFSQAFPSRGFPLCPMFMASIVWKAFFSGIELYPPGCSCGLASERSTLSAQKSGVRAPHLRRVSVLLFSAVRFSYGLFFVSIMRHFSIWSY